MNHYAIGHLADKGGRHYWLAQQLRRDGYRPMVFGCNERHDGDGAYFSDKRPWHVEYDRIRVPYITINSTPYTGNGISRVRNMAMFAWNLIRAAQEVARKRGKPDVIYASSVHPLTVLAGELLAKEFGMPCIGEVRDLWPETLVAYGSLTEGSLAARLLYAGEKFMYARADAMIFTMEGAPDYIREHGWTTEQGGPIDLKRVYHMNNGVDLRQFDRNAVRYVLPDPELDDPELFCVVYTGAIKRANNLGKVLEMAEYLRDLPDLRILIWGEGNETEDLIRKTRERGLDRMIRFKGCVEKKYVPAIVKRSDVNLMHWEQSSVNRYGYDYNKLFDYLAAGRVVYSTIRSGHSLLVRLNCGIETGGGAPEDFAKGIRDIYNMSPEERSGWGERARQAAHEYDFKVLTRKLERIIEAL